MTVFFDCGVFLNIVEGTEDSSGSGALELCQRLGFRTVISWHTLANLYHLIRGRLRSEGKSVEVIEALLASVDVIGGAHREAVRALALNQGDYEDALQLALAESVDADCLVSANTTRYSLDSTVPVIAPAAFVEKFGGN